MIKFFCLLVLTFTAVTSGKPRGRIISGSDAKEGEYPYYALLSSVIPGGFLFSQSERCGGNVLAHHWILTAAHCVLHHEPQNIWVHVGFIDQRKIKYQQRSSAAAKFVHPGYREDNHSPLYPNDIALLNLKQGFFFYALVRPIALPRSKRDRVFDYEFCEVAGFGDSKMGMDDRVFPDVLQKAETNIYGAARCKQKWGWRLHTDLHVCAFKPSTFISVCQGDSGGPLSCFDHSRNETVLRGLSSWVQADCDGFGYPQVFARVSWYVGWVKDTMRYGEWVMGECSVSCGEGTRLDRRTCDLEVYCDDPDVVLNRVSKCTMPACPDFSDVCRDLECSPDAVCLPGDLNEDYECKCLPEYDGNGKICNLLYQGESL